MIEHNYDAYVNIMLDDHTVSTYADRIETNTMMFLLQSQLTLRERTNLCRTLYHDYIL
jgi:hypothetical protein